MKPLYGDLAPFLNFFLNNLGDAYAKSNYAISTQELELEVIEKFTEVCCLMRVFGLLEA